MQKPSVIRSLISEDDATAAMFRLTNSREASVSALSAPRLERTAWWWESREGETREPSSSSVLESISLSDFDAVNDSEMHATRAINDPALTDDNPNTRSVTRAVPPPASIMGNDAGSAVKVRIAACLLHDDVTSAQRLIAIASGKAAPRPRSTPSTASMSHGASSPANTRGGGGHNASSSLAYMSTSTMPRLCSYSATEVVQQVGSSVPLAIRLSSDPIFMACAKGLGCTGVLPRSLHARSVRHGRRAPRHAVVRIDASAAVEANAENIGRLKSVALSLSQFRLSVASLRAELRDRPFTTSDAQQPQRRV